MTQPSQEPFAVFGDRRIVLKKMTDLQLMLLARETDKIRRDESDKLGSAAKIMDLLEAVVVSEEDREFLTRETIAGRFDLPDALELVKTTQTEMAQSKPAVRRGRPRKRV